MPQHKEDFTHNSFMLNKLSGCKHGEEVKQKRTRPKSKSNLNIIKDINETS